MLKFKANENAAADATMLSSALRTEVGRAMAILLKTFDKWTHENAQQMSRIDREMRRSRPDYYQICTWLRMLQERCKPEDLTIYTGIINELDTLTRQAAK